MNKDSILLRWMEPRVSNVRMSIKIVIVSFILFFFLAISNIGRSGSIGGLEKFIYLAILCLPFALSFLYTVSGYFAVSDQMTSGIKKSLFKIIIFSLGCFQIFWIVATLLDFAGI
jgi:hypothetical protein